MRNVVSIHQLFQQGFSSQSREIKSQGRTQNDANHREHHGEGGAKNIPARKDDWGAGDDKRDGKDNQEDIGNEGEDAKTKDKFPYELCRTKLPELREQERQAGKEKYNAGKAEVGQKTMPYFHTLERVTGFIMFSIGTVRPLLSGT